MIFRTNDESTLEHCGTIARDQVGYEFVAIVRDDGVSPNLDGCWYSPIGLVIYMPSPEFYTGKKYKCYEPDSFDFSSLPMHDFIRTLGV